MAERVPQSVAYLWVFRAFLASDGKTPATGKTIAITISKNGATSFSNPAAGALNATEMASGFYKAALGTDDLDTVGPLALRGAEGTINDAGEVLSVVKATNAGFSALPDAAADGAGGLPISDAGGVDLDAQLVTKINALIAGVVVSSIGNNVITTASIANGAYTAAKFNADVTTAFQAGLATAAALATAQTSIDDLPTNTELTAALAAADDATLAAIAGLNNLSAAQVNAEVDSALADINLDHLIKIAVDTNFLTTVHVDSVIGQMVQTANGGFDRADDSLESLRDRGDVAWITGTSLDAAGIRTAVGLATANLDTQLSAINSKTTNLPSDPADASDIAAAFSTVNSTLSTILGHIDTEIATLTTNLATVSTNLSALITTVGVAGASLTNLGDARLANLDALVSSRLASAGYTAPDNTSITAIKKVVEADQVVDNTGTGPWELVYIERGTGDLGVGTELLRKRLKDVDGVDISDTDTVIGEARE